MANAIAAQEPDPAPQNAREDDADGNKPGGQAPDGKDNNKPPPARERTNATERTANAPRPTTPKDATENTVALGKAARTVASTPAAQPTATAASAGTAAQTAASAGGTTDREPEKPTTDADPMADKRAEGSIAKTKLN